MSQKTTCHLECTYWYVPVHTSTYDHEILVLPPYTVLPVCTDLPNPVQVYRIPDVLANRPAAAMRLGCRCCHSLSVLKSHFNRARSFVLKQLLSKSEKRFVRTHWLQEVLGLSEVL
jgi:hypothetical protein